MHIEIIAGSPRQGSLSLRVAKHLHQKLQNEWTEATVGLINMNETKIPQIQNVWTSVDKAPEQYRSIAERMFKADGFILVSPEYNGGYSPAMKNLLDHFPKQTKKPFGICTSSSGKMGGMRATQQLLQLVPALFGIASPTLLIVPEVDQKFDENGGLVDASYEHQISNFVTDFKWLADKLI